MLVLYFAIGPQRCAIESRVVIEVTPRVQLAAAALAPAHVAGFFNFRGAIVPVIDLCRLFLERPCRDAFSTRIVVVRYPEANGCGRPLGLLAEGVVSTGKINPTKLKDAGLAIPNAPFLGQVHAQEQAIVQFVRVEQLLTAELKSILFQDRP
jgi:chemotaxis-related protein WspB